MASVIPLRAVAAALAAAASGVLAPSSPAQSYDEVLARYQEYLQRPSLWKRTVGRRALAATRDPRALEVLAASYDRPEEPEAVVRHLIATIAMKAFGRSADPDVLSSWRQRHDETEDAWLWFETQRYTADRELPALAAQALGKGDPFLRAVALEAIADRTRRVGVGPESADLCLQVLDTLPRKELDRAVLLESVASVVLANRPRIRGDVWKPVAERVIRELDERATPHRSKVVIARHMALALDCPNLGLESHWWLGELEREARRESGGGRTTTVPFFSLRTTGYRFAYVIDASDSMLKRVTDRQRRDVGPTTGGRPKPKEGEPGFVPEADDIDWNRVITRFDAAREYLRLSLSSLGEEHEFVIVLFGDEAQTLAATPKLVPANKRTIRAALAELDAIEVGPPTNRRPDGQLRGQTNLHAGFAAAFRVTSSGATRKQEYIDPKGFTDGCDTVFVLSDGAPSWDDYPELDRRDPEDQAGDPETGMRFENRPELVFQGPYGLPPFDLLVADVRRMNLFRKAEILCVGIGEANHGLLKSLASVGLGRSIRVEGERGKR